MTLQRSLKLSLFLHLIVLILIGGGPKGCSRGGGEGDSKEKSEEQAQSEHEKEEQIAEKQPDVPMEITLIEQTQEERDAAIEKARRKEIAECEPHFGGLGIEYDGKTGVINKVYKYYPASDAGIQVNDQILSPPIREIRGEIGTDVTLVVNRNGQTFSQTITRGRICLTDAKKENP